MWVDPPPYVNHRKPQFGSVGGTAEPMSKLLRGLVAGWGAKKMGCGCFGTILAFLVLWWLLGNFEIFR